MDIRDKIAEIKSKTNILDVVSASVSLKKSGRQWVGLCPFHSDTKPSFYVSTEKQSYRCFGCGAAGDVVAFLMNFQHLTFKDAVTELARRAGVELKWRPDEETKRTNILYELNETSAIYYQKALYEQEGRTALGYLMNRGFKKQTLDEFVIGYAPANWRIIDYLKSKGFDEETIIAAGVCSRREGKIVPLLRNRVVFPITDGQGKVLGFGGRALSDEDSPKYINSPETVLFKKSSVLYGIKQAKEAARKSNELLLTEGYTDVMMAHQRSIKNVCAVLGTAFTIQHAQAMKRYAEKVILVFDSDNAGERAATRSIDILLSAGLDIRIAQLPQGLDLCDFLVEHSGEELVQLAKGATRFIEFLHSICVKEYGEGVEGKKRTIERLSEALSHIESETECELWARETAKLTGVSYHTILNAATARNRRVERKQDKVSYGKIPVPLTRDYELLEMMILSPSMIAEVKKHFGTEDFADEDLRIVAEYIFKQDSEFGILNLENLYNQAGGERLRQKVKSVLERARGLATEEERRDYQKLLNAWVKRRIGEKRLCELEKELKTGNVEALLEMCKLKDALKSDDLSSLTELCREKCEH